MLQRRKEELECMDIEELREELAEVAGSFSNERVCYS